MYCQKLPTSVTWKIPVLLAFLTEFCCAPKHSYFNPLKAELNPIFHLLALLGAHHIFHVSGLRVKPSKSGRMLSLIFSTLYCLYLSKGSVQARDFLDIYWHINFISWVVRPSTNIKLEDHPLLAVRDCFPYVEALFSIRDGPCLERRNPLNDELFYYVLWQRAIVAN